MPDYSPPFGRHSNHTRRRHLITFGHPYSCTPLLNAIFEFNRSPSHAEVTKIMKQTGLRRKQLTSWFWRKRKELAEPPEVGSKFDHSLDRSRSPCRLSPQLSSVIKPYVLKTKGYSKNNEEEDDEYRPPGHPVVKKSSSSRGRMLSHMTRKQSTSIEEKRTGAGLLAQNDAPTKPHNRSSDSQSQLQCVPSTIFPEREPLLVRCRLRPLGGRVLPGTTVAGREDPNEFTQNEKFGNFLVKDPVGSSRSIPTIPKEKDGDKKDALQTANSRSHMQQSGFGSDTLVHSYGPMPYDDMVLHVNEPPPEHVPSSVPSQRDSDLRHDQLGLETISRSQESCFPTTRRSGSKNTSWLKPGGPLIYSPSSAIETISKQNSIALRNNSSSPNRNNSCSIDVSENVCWQISPQETNLSAIASTTLLSLGEEVHRWSEISNIDCASRYSTESKESRQSCCTSAAVEDYSALLSTSPTPVLFSDSPTPQQGCSNGSNPAKNDDRTLNFPAGGRHTSISYGPLDQSTKTASLQEENDLGFTSTTALLKDTSEFEEDQNLFMPENSHLEFLNLMDWNPLGSFMNISY